MRTGVLDLILAAGWPTKMVLVVLIGFSVATWAVIFQKWRSMRRVQADNNDFIQAYNQAPSLLALAQTPGLPTSQGLGFLFRDAMEKTARHTGEGYTSEWLQGLERRLKGTIREDLFTQERYLAVLATTGNVAPFIGLFGTVWGIITAFQEIAQAGSASISAVAPGVAEALVATAAGLFAAIPAVVAYNYYLSRINSQSAQMESFSSEFIDILHDNGIHNQPQGK